VLLASFATFVSTWISHGLHSGVRGGIAVFLGWALVRELAPKRLLPSALAPYAVIAFAIPAQTDLLACWCALMACRIASRSVGDPPTLPDLVLLAPFAAWAATRPAGLPVALVLAAIVFLEDPKRRARLAGIVTLLFVLLSGATEGTLTLRPGWDDPTVLEQLLLAATIATAAWLLLAHAPARLRTRDDRKRGPLLGHRVRSARVAAVACIVAAVAWTGVEGAFALSSVSGAILAVGIGGARMRAARPGRVATR